MSNIFIALERMEYALERHPGRLSRAITLVILALRIRRERNQLAKLSDEQLADIGVDRATARSESARGLADIPAHRRANV